MEVKCYENCKIMSASIINYTVLDDNNYLDKNGQICYNLDINKYLMFQIIWFQLSLIL